LPFDGSTSGAAGLGIGHGTLLRRPATCTTGPPAPNGPGPGVGYWANDQGTWNTSPNTFPDGSSDGQLYLCTATNTWTLNYTPFTYPHPLVTGVAQVGAVTVVPSSENFGSVLVGSSSATQTATLTNTTAAGVTISSVTTTGTNPADFPNNSNTCSGTIAANGGTCAVVTHFAPTSAGARAATLTIATSSGSFPVALTGTGTSPVNPGISIAPGSAAFGNITVGMPSASTPFTMTSTTSTNLVMGTPPATITGANPGDFALVAVGGQCTNGQSIPQSSTCTESVVFTPTATGARSAQLNISDNVTGSPQVLPLSGTGVGVIALNPVSMNFGNIAQGQTSAGQLLTMTNNTGVTITLIGVTFTNLDFAANPNTCNSGTLANGQSCTMSITFRPSATTGTNESGIVLINFTGVGGSPASIPLTGTVLPPIGTPNTAIFSIVVTGSGFMPGSVVYQNGAPCTTSTYVSPTEMNAMCPVTATIVVNNPVVLSTVRVNAGGPAYTDTAGNVWSADKGFTGGAAAVFPASTPITGTTDPALYQTERWGSSGVFSYTFPVTNGKYNVTLRFVENYFSSPGQRIFNVVINGNQVLTNFDIYAAAGAKYKAVDKTFPVTVSGGSINIQFVNDAAVAGIAIVGG